MRRNGGDLGALPNCSQSCSQGLYSLAPQPRAFGLPDTSAWGSSRSKQSTLSPNLLSLFYILYVDRRKAPPASHHLASKGLLSSLHASHKRVTTCENLCSTITALFLDEAAAYKLASLPLIHFPRAAYGIYN